MCPFSLSSDPRPYFHWMHPQEFTHKPVVLFDLEGATVSQWSLHTKGKAQEIWTSS